LPELAWAYFHAYRTILYGNLVRFTVLKTGVEEPDKYLSDDGIKKILKTILPHLSTYIDGNEPQMYHYLLEHIEGYLLVELRKILEGKDADQAAAERAKEIMDVVKSAGAERAEIAIGAANGD
jgi:hypothetical protein